MENWFKTIFDEYYALLERVKTMIASHVVLNSSKIARNKPELKSEIIDQGLRNRGFEEDQPLKKSIKK